MNAPDTRHALLITSAWLALVAEKYRLNEDESRATLRHKGEVLGKFTLGQALDLADDALADRCSTLTCDAPLKTDDEILTGFCEEHIAEMAQAAGRDFASEPLFPDAGSRA